jgi:Conserved hypothetical ATP binding protein
MPNVAVLVMGPAGAGKVNTARHLLCADSVCVDDVLQCADGCHNRAEATRVVRQPRSRGGGVHLGTSNRHTPSTPGRELTADIRDLISLEDVMEELELGPNGGLVYCFESPPNLPLR